MKKCGTTENEPLFLEPNLGHVTTPHEAVSSLYYCYSIQISQIYLICFNNMYFFVKYMFLKISLLFFLHYLELFFLI